jgi:23S rRNA U2552 (ribose-2'-O)-methylase RlmE/FtsJ
MKISELLLKKTYDTDKYSLGYLDNFYDDFLINYENKDINILEIGTYGGGSIKLWKDYFTPNSKIYAGDIVSFEEISGTISVIDDLYSDNCVNKFKDDYFDLIIDDGPHTPESFNSLVYKYHTKLKDGGYIVIEDIIDVAYIEPLVKHILEIGYVECDIIDMTGKQKNHLLLDQWKNGLYIIKIKK